MVVVLVLCVSGVALLAFEEEVSSLFFVKDLRRGIRNAGAKAKVAAAAAAARNKVEAPPAPNAVRAGGYMRGVAMADGDGAGTVKGADPDEWKRDKREFDDEARAIAEEMGAAKPGDTNNDGRKRKDVMREYIPRLTDILKGALDTAEGEGGEMDKFFGWKRVKPKCKVGAKALAHTAKRIREAELVLDPYPHVQVFNIFPDALYACIMSKMPAGDGAYVRLKEGVDRFMVDLYDRKKAAKGKKDKRWDVMDGKGGFDAGFWQDFGAAYATDTGIRDAWLDKFAPTLAVRHANYAAVKSSIHTKMELNRDRAGYEIGPHTDSQGKWVTTLYYLAKDLEHEKTGTCVVRSKTGRTQTEGSVWEDWRDPDFEIATQARYVPNSVFAFAPCFGSWHAVPKVTGRNGFVRDTIQTFLMEATKSAPKKECPKVPNTRGSMMDEFKARSKKGDTVWG